MTLERLNWADLDGWLEDDHEAALQAFMTSAAAPTSPELRRLLDAASAASGRARAFFERNFEPHRVEADATSPLLTGYFEPEIEASRSSISGFHVPLHSRPANLVTVVSESDRGSVPAETRTHLLDTPEGLRVAPTRQEIDQGALDEHCRDLFYVADEIDRFIVQVQGSAALRLPDGTLTRVTYDGKNGHPYTSLGRLLVDRGEIPAHEMSLARLVDWLKADPERARRTIWANESYVFFRELPADEAAAPIGVMGTPLVPGRSLAVDPAHNPLGLPVYVEAPDLTSVTGAPFRRLLVAHDVGSAIKGRSRGDLFVGTGTEAGLIAGTIKHPVRFTRLHPRSALR